MSAEIQNVEFEVVSHRPYSPDLALSDFWLFATLKKHTKGIYFTCAEEVQAATGKRYRGRPKESLRCWRSCIEREEDSMKN